MKREEKQERRAHAEVITLSQSTTEYFESGFTCSDVVGHRIEPRSRSSRIELKEFLMEIN